MKLIDEKGRLFGKLSIIDLGIILAVLVVLAGVYVKFMVLDQTSVTAEMSDIRYTVEVGGVREYIFDNVQVGDKLYFGTTDVGTIVEIQSQPYEDTAATMTGDVFKAQVPDRYTVCLVVEGSATVSDGKILASRTVELGTGNSSRSFTTKFASFSGIVKDIEFDG